MAASAFGPAGILGAAETTIELPSWAEFVGELAMNTSPNWIFRGHANLEWTLTTTLQRAFAEAAVTDDAQRAAVENSIVGSSRIALGST